MPFGVDALGRALGAMAGGDLIGLGGIAVVEQLARDQPALRPPAVAVAEERGIARHLRQRLGRLGRLVGAPGLLRLQEGEGDVALQRGRHGLDQLGGDRRPRLGAGEPGPGEDDIVDWKRAPHCAEPRWRSRRRG